MKCLNGLILVHSVVEDDANGQNDNDNSGDDNDDDNKEK